MSSTFGMASGPADENAMERIMQLKRIQRRTGTMPLSPMGNDDWAGWNRPQEPASGNSRLQAPASGNIDATLTPSTRREGQPTSAVSDLSILKALKDTVRYLRSNSTEHGMFVDPHSYHSSGVETGEAMLELLKEMEALKSRDASSATVLRMAKENLDQRKQQITQLQEELASRKASSGSTTAQLSGDLQSKDRQLQEVTERERAAQEMARELDTSVKRLQADIEARRQQDEHMHELLHEVEAQRDVHQQEIAAMRAENQRLLAQKAEEMDNVLQEAAQEVEAVRAAMSRGGQMPAAPAPGAPRSLGISRPESTEQSVHAASSSKSRAPSSTGAGAAEVSSKSRAPSSTGAGAAEVENLKEALADVSTDLQEREEELSAAQKQVLELQQLLKRQSDVLSEMRVKEAELSRERGFMEGEAGASGVGAMQALQTQVSRQKATITLLQDQLESLADRENELAKCKEVISEMERHKQEVDGLLDEVQEDRHHRDAVISELKKLRTAVQQKDALIAELNEQLHSPNVRQESTAPSLFKVQQMQRDIQELRTAVQQRDALIAELNSRLQQDGQGDLSHAGNLAERERALSAQTEQLQLVSQHQFEMQAQLAAVQKALQEQQSMLAQQAVDAQRQQQQSFQLAAQSQQLAALQQGINSMGRGGHASVGGGKEVLRLDAPESNRATHNHIQNSASIDAPEAASGFLPKTPTSQEWSQSMGVQAVEEQVRKARSLARSAAAAASVARNRASMSNVIPTEVTM